MAGTLSGSSSIILDGVAGEQGDEGMTSSARAVRRLMVTRLEVGSASELDCRWLLGGVCGGAANSALLLSSFSVAARAGPGFGTESELWAASTDLLREPPPETRCRFREACSW